jgi:sugar lactone lactonase YvrE
VAGDLAGLTAPNTTAGLIFAIGERGISPGQFNDARSVAVANDGRIFVADRQSGRLQIFAPDGTYQTTLPWQQERFTDDLEIGPDGILYAQQNSRIYRFDSTTAEELTDIVYSHNNLNAFSKLAMAVNGDLLAINGQRNTIVRFDATGNVQQTISMEIVPMAQSFENLAVDGLGNVYVIGVAHNVLGDRQNVVFKFTANGQFASQFGSDGREPGTFMGSVWAIAVDGQGRIYAADFQGVQIFDNNGRYLNLIKIDGAARDIAISNQGELVIITGQHKLYKFDLSEIGN